VDPRGIPQYYTVALALRKPAKMTKMFNFGAVMTTLFTRQSQIWHQKADAKFDRDGFILSPLKGKEPQI